MSRKERLLSAVDVGREAIEAFVEGLPEEERDAAGTYEKWCAKDNVAHIVYWIESRAKRMEALARGEAPSPGGDYEAARCR